MYIGTGTVPYPIGTCFTNYNIILSGQFETRNNFRHIIIGSRVHNILIYYN